MLTKLLRKKVRAEEQNDPDEKTTHCLYLFVSVFTKSLPQHFYTFRQFGIAWNNCDCTAYLFQERNIIEKIPKSLNYWILRLEAFFEVT